MTIINKCPFCDARYPGRGEVCSKCQEYFNGMFLCGAEKLPYDQKVSLGRFIMYLKRKDEKAKTQKTNPSGGERDN